MRIGIVSNTTEFGKGGPSATVAKLGFTFLARGHQVNTICWPARVWLGHPAGTLRHFVRVLITIVRFRCDVVSIHNCFVGLAAAYVARSLIGCKICFTFHTVPAADETKAMLRAGSFSINHFRLFMLKKSDTLTTVSEFIVDRLRHFGWTSLPPITVIPSGVDLDNTVVNGESFTPPGPPHPTLRLLSVGVLAWRWKVEGHVRALRCLAACRHTLGDFEFFIAGAGPLRKELEAEVEKLQLQANVRLLGNVDDLAPQYDRADVYLHFAENEGCSLALLEALARGLPVVASAKGGNGAVLLGLEGVLILDGSEAEVVEQFRQDAVLSGWLASRARYARPSLARYSWDVIAERYLQIFRQALGTQ